MGEYEVGYGKPPKRHRFKKGVSANPKGRPKRKASSLADIIERVMKAPLPYREGGRSKTASRRQLSLETLMRRALRGDVRSVELLLKLRAHAQRLGEDGVQTIRIMDWLPNYPGQTAEQKMQELDAESSAQWNNPSAGPIGEDR
jgi:hypothetical protein